MLKCLEWRPLDGSALPPRYGWVIVYYGACWGPSLVGQRISHAAPFDGARARTGCPDQ